MEIFNRITAPLPFGLVILNWIVQRIFRVNARIKWQIHYTSKCTGKVTIGRNVWISMASSANCYIQGGNGVVIGDDTIFGPGVKIISANHDFNNYASHTEANPIYIGKHCWIGANSIILPEVQLGDNVIVGAGSVVTKSFPSNVVIAGNPAKILRAVDESN